MEHDFMVEVRNMLNGQHDVRIVRIDRMKAALAPEASTRASHGLLLRLGTSYPFPAHCPTTAFGRFLPLEHSKEWHAGFVRAPRRRNAAGMRCAAADMVSGTLVEFRRRATSKQETQHTEF